MRALAFMSAALWCGAALAAQPTSNPGTTLAAAGTTQATAALLVFDRNYVTTVASGAGVILQPAAGGFATSQVVFNRGANALLVYPPSGAQIETGAANASYSLASGGHATFECVSATQCYVGP